MDKRYAQFGSIFRHNEKEYVYLVHTEEILYSALIVDIQGSEALKKRVEYIIKNKGTPLVNRLLDYKIYCFVELRTEEVKNRLALFAKTGEDTPLEDCLPINPIGELDKEDLKEIKQHIESSNGVPKELKEKMKSIVIES
jgi:hypothetical protein